MIVEGKLGNYQVFIRQVGARSVELVVYKNKKYRNRFFQWMDWPSNPVWQSPGETGVTWKQFRNMAVIDVIVWADNVVKEYEAKKSAQQGTNSAGPC